MKAENRQRAASMSLLTAYWESAQGRAREAYERGDNLFEVTVPAISTDRTVTSMLYGDPSTTRIERRVVGTLTAIEASGWHLEHAGYVFEQTGSVSRDKLMSSGQVERVTGQVLGIYLFRRVPGDFARVAPKDVLAAVHRVEELTGEQSTRFPDMRNPEVAAAVADFITAALAEARAQSANQI